jgi:undecaprenyl-diphosphatase
MDLWQAFILGVVEGVTEFLPISSTGHLILTSRALNLPSTDFLKSFEIIIQLGAILAVVCLYWRSLFVDSEVLKRIVAAFIPTAIIGVGVYKFVKSVLLESVDVVVWALILGGVFLIIFERRYKEGPYATADIAKLSYKNAVLIGVFQAIAMIPGVSRAAATIIGGLVLGMKRKTIVEFSFLLAVPTMLAATVLDFYKSSHLFSADQISFLAVGFVTSMVVAMAAIRFLLRFIQSHNFVAFGIYRIAIGLLFLSMIVLRKISAP